MPLLSLSPVPDFLLWSPFSYYNFTFLLSSDNIFSTKNAQQPQKQFRSMTALVLPFVWAAPLHPPRPSFVLFPLFVCAVPVRAHWPSFALVDTHRLFGQAPFVLSIHLLVPVLVWLSLVLIVVSLVLHLCSYSFCLHSFRLGWAHLGSFALPSLSFVSVLNIWLVHTY